MTPNTPGPVYRYWDTWDVRKSRVPEIDAPFLHRPAPEPQPIATKESRRLTHEKQQFWNLAGTTGRA